MVRILMNSVEFKSGQGKNIGYAGPPGKLIQDLFECFIVKMDLVRDVLSMNPVDFVIQ